MFTKEQLGPSTRSLPIASTKLGLSSAPPSSHLPTEHSGNPLRRDQNSRGNASELGPPGSCWSRGIVSRWCHTRRHTWTHMDTQTGPTSMPTWASCPSLQGPRGLHSACNSPLYTTLCLAHQFHVSLAGSAESQLRGPQPCPSKRTQVQGTGKPPSSVVQCSQAGQGQTL